MSHPWRSEPGILLLAPVTTVEQAAGAAAAGALDVQALAVVGRTDDLDHLLGIIDHLDQ